MVIYANGVCYRSSAVGSTWFHSFLFSVRAGHFSNSPEFIGSKYEKRKGLKSLTSDHYLAYSVVIPCGLTGDTSSCLPEAGG